jgi:hypothetical protein
MKQFTLTALFLVLTFTAHAEIYKWVDKNGTIHFTDKVYTDKAKEVKIQGTGINVQNTEGGTGQEIVQNSQEGAKGKSIKTATPVVEDQAKDEEREITEADYKITSSVGKLGGDVISISGRISSGPACKNMIVTATARNENGLSAMITQQISKSTSYGSTIYEGVAKVSGSAEDYSFWQVDTVTVRCND